MTLIHVSAEGGVAAPADTVYGYLADYRAHHPNILPPAFTDIQIEEGGVGDGTVLRVEMKAMGRTFNFHLFVKEVQPGRVLTERDAPTGQLTTFTVTPEGTDRSRVRIETQWEKGGIAGLIERMFATRFTRKLFIDEIARLDAYARSQRAEALQPA